MSIFGHRHNVLNNNIIYLRRKYNRAARAARISVHFLVAPAKNQRVLTTTLIYRDKLKIKPGSEPGFEPGSELGSEPGFET